MAEDNATPDPQAAQVQRFLSGDPVIDRALGLIPPMSNPVKPMKRTELNPLVQKTLSPTAAAFHTAGSPQLTVLTDSPMYQAASNEQDRLSNYLLASAILHEKQHDQYPTTELEPYTAQLQFLKTFQPDSTPQAFKAYQESVKQIQHIIDGLKKGK